jgi:hypothetical protein
VTIIGHPVEAASRHPAKKVKLTQLSSNKSLKFNQNLLD